MVHSGKQPGIKGSIWKKIGIGCGTIVGLVVIAIMVLRFIIQSNIDAASAASLEGRYGDAIKHYKTILSINPDIAECHEVLAEAYIHNHQQNEAIAELKAAIRLEPKNVEYHNDLTHYYLDTGFYPEAESEALSALRVDNSNATAHNNLGAAYAKQARFDDAILEYQTALQLNPGMAEAHKNLERLQRRMNLR